MRKRWKRKSGYNIPDLIISKKDLVANDLFLNEEYDDWNDWRDGMRDRFRDNKLIKNISKGLKGIYQEIYNKRVKMNKKQKKLLKRRKAKIY